MCSRTDDYCSHESVRKYVEITCDTFCHQVRKHLSIVCHELLSAWTVVTWLAIFAEFSSTLCWLVLAPHFKLLASLPFVSSPTYSDHLPRLLSNRNRSPKMKEDPSGSFPRLPIVIQTIPSQLTRIVLPSSMSTPSGYPFTTGPARLRCPGRRTRPCRMQRVTNRFNLRFCKYVNDSPSFWWTVSIKISWSDFHWKIWFLFIVLLSLSLDLDPTISITHVRTRYGFLNQSSRWDVFDVLKKVTDDKISVLDSTRRDLWVVFRDARELYSDRNIENWLLFFSKRRIIINIFTFVRWHSVVEYLDRTQLWSPYIWVFSFSSTYNRIDLCLTKAFSVVLVSKLNDTKLYFYTICILLVRATSSRLIGTKYKLYVQWYALGIIMMISNLDDESFLIFTRHPSNSSFPILNRNWTRFDALSS